MISHEHAPSSDEPVADKYNPRRIYESNRMTRYDVIQERLRCEAKRWVVTGAAGFIGSHLVEKLLQLGQYVVGLDNLTTGRQDNLEEVRRVVSAAEWNRFRFVRGDICEIEDCRSVCGDAHYVLHQAALGSVPRSLKDPLNSHESNVSGFLNMLVAARDAGVRRFIYASSSSVYGDHTALPKVEQTIGQPLSPYAATKLIAETYAKTFTRCYSLPTIGLRYFNVFGPRQDPHGAYAAVVPRWFTAATEGAELIVHGDGETSRDFCYIENVVQANLLAAISEVRDDIGLFNIAVGQQTTLNALAAQICALVSQKGNAACHPKITRGPERAGDIRHSLADITLARVHLGYEPTHDLRQGLLELSDWYVRPQRVVSL